MTARRRMQESLWALLAAGLVIAFMRVFVFMPFYVSSRSMQPALEQGDFVLVNELAYQFHPPRRGDVVVFRYPQHEEWAFLKRVVGLPGDRLAEGDGRLWVNSTPIADASIVPVGDDLGSAFTLAAGRIPADHLFVLGDNRGASLDSRFWGPVDEREVIGKAFLIYWSRGRHWWDIRWRRIGRWLR